MKLVQLILYFCLNLSIAYAQSQSGNYSLDMTASTQGGEAGLQLTTNIVNQNYCSEAGVGLLKWTLNLTFTNIGNQSILLDKQSSLIFGSMVSHDLKAASAKRYEYEVISSYIMLANLRKAGIRDSKPELNAFVILKPGESYNLQKDYRTHLYDGTKDSEDSVHPGNHFLQIRVATWYYFDPPEMYREQWRDKGYLWSHNITSSPMPFRVEEKPSISKCSDSR